MGLTVSASVLAGDHGALAAEAIRASEAGADMIHVDVMDGRFVPPITFGQGVVEALGRAVALPLDVHLMVCEPERQVPWFVEAGAQLITVHVEASVHLHRVLGEIRQAGCGAGVALNPGTAAESVFPVLDLVDLVLVMTVNPGYAGQTFLPGMLSKVTKLLQLRTELARQPMIGVDGGVDPATAGQAIAAGADFLVAGTSIFRAADMAGAVAALRGATRR
ncbi:MAG TPA: ribulose-phosphate 3-epimerase [Bacillota bacterium]|nr:ribulose-phosphate 3-epimerase [Bacillota bacterium]